MSLKNTMKAKINVPCPPWKDPIDLRVNEGINSTFGKELLRYANTEHDPFGVLSLHLVL